MGKENNNENSNDRSIGIEGRAALLQPLLSVGFIGILICIGLIYYSIRYGLLAIVLSVVGSLLIISVCGIVIYNGLNLNQKLIDALDKEPEENKTKEKKQV